MSAVTFVISSPLRCAVDRDADAAELGVGRLLESLVGLRVEVVRELVVEAVDRTLDALVDQLVARDRPIVGVLDRVERLLHLLRLVVGDEHVADRLRQHVRVAAEEDPEREHRDDEQCPAEQERYARSATGHAVSVSGPPMLRLMTEHRIDPEIAAHYELGLEHERLERLGQVERLRTRVLLERLLPPAPAVVLDVGGAAGVHALPLAADGYEVRLLDPVALHVEQAAAASAAQAGRAAGGGGRRRRPRAAVGRRERRRGAAARPALPPRRRPAGWRRWRRRCGC